MAAPSSDISCEDFGLFQDVLKRLRMIDDRVVHELNTTLPTESFKGARQGTELCKDFYEQLFKAHMQRDRLIKRCVGQSSSTVSALRQRREQDTGNTDLLRTLRKEQTKLRLMQAELNVEEVVRDRSLKVFYERCRLLYVPNDVKPS